MRNDDVVVVVDVQVDFAPGCDGALPVPGADATVPAINKVVGMFSRVIATRDAHPPDHCSFVENNGPFPRHCVIGTEGFQYHPDFNTSAIQVEIRKGTNKDKECFSGFEAGCINLFHAISGGWPVENQRVFVVGWATEYCIQATALDAVRNGFKVYVISDAVAGVTPETSASAVKEMQEAGVIFITSDELERIDD